MFRFRPALLVSFLGLACLHSALASYDSGPGWESYPAAPVSHHHQGWTSSGGGGGAAAGGHGAHNGGGSYYHYHVPLVNQQAQPAPHHDNHHLLLILPLLLLAGLPLLLVPLLPLILLPLGLSLLALLLPLLMMGGMMMMMMMPGGMMMMMMRNADHPTRNAYHGEVRKLGGYLVDDLSQLVGRYARSLDLDHCPERLACEAGSYIYPLNSEESTTKYLINYFVDKAYPKGTKARRFIRSYEKAFWFGSSTGQCQQHKCQPSFHPERIVRNDTTAASGPEVPSKTAESTPSEPSKNPEDHPSKNSVFKRRTLGATSGHYRATSTPAPSSVYYQYPASYSYPSSSSSSSSGGASPEGAVDTTLYFARRSSNNTAHG